MKRSKFDKLIESAPEIPTLPAVATQVMQIVRNPSSAARDLEEIVSFDPVLASSVMRMTNSAYYGLPNEITELHRAIVLLGFNAVRNLAFTASVKSLYGHEYKCGTFSASSLWLHSVSVAVISQMLAKKTWPELGDEAFLAGILHDVGIIVEWNLLPDQFDRVIRYSEGTGLAFADAEKKALGFDHTLCGAAMLRRWKLPRHLIYVSRHHHGKNQDSHTDDLSNASVGDRLACLVHLAEHICAERGNGFFDEPRDHDRTTQLLEAVSCTPDDYRWIVDNADEQLNTARDILAL